MTTLTLQEKTDYLTNYILPTFKPMYNQNLYASIFDVEGKLLFTTNKSARSVGHLKPEEMYGESYNTPSEFIIKECVDRFNLDRQIFLDVTKKIYRLQMFAVEKKRVISYISLLPYAGLFKGYWSSIMPLFHPNGEVIGFLCTATDYHLFGLNEFLLHYEKEIMPVKLSISNDELNIKLSKRQHEILFLICNGFSQEHAANILNISRGTVAKVITDQICPKFKIYSNSVKLIQTAKKLGIDRMIPKSLWAKYIIIFDKEAAEVINQEKL